MSLGWELVTDVDDENPVAGDLRVVNGRFARLPDKKASVAQACSVVLLWWLGEWFLDPSRGMPYLQKILGIPGISVGTVRALLARELRKVKYVRDLVAANIVLDRKTGLCTASDLEVEMDDGQTFTLAGPFSGNG